MIAELLAPQRVLGLIANALNRVLAGQPGALEQLRRLHGRTMDVRVAKLGWRLCVAFDEEGVVLATSSARTADVTLEGSLPDLLALEGDLATVQLVQAVFESLALDWEAFLAQYLGELPARQVARVMLGILDWVGRTRVTFERDLGEYLRTEARLVPAREETNLLASELMRLVNDVDRLAARIARLQQRRSRP